MATTTNFGWTTPDDTSLVKDGAAAIRSLGQAIDTSMMDLEGGTTGQILTKNSATDMDFVWATPAAGGAYTQLATGSLSGNSVSITSISSGYQDLLLTMQDFSPDTAEASLLIRVNSSSANYRNFYNRMIGGTFGATSGSSSAEFFEIASMNVANDSNYLRAQFFNYADTTIFKRASGQDYYLLNNGSQLFASLEGLWRDTSAISSIQMTLSAGDFDGGTYTLYGVK